jgi:proteasome lid subunit RPN8/RPN11
MTNPSRLEITSVLLARIHQHGEAAYPEEGAGFMLGRVDGDRRQVFKFLTVENAREDGARHNRYLVQAQDVLRSELEAERLGLDVIGIFHSHPDHPDCPSEIDREWALPWLSYLITSVSSGRAVSSRSWRLSDDREQFVEEPLISV